MKNIICGIDGVLLHNNKLIPGSDKCIHRVLEQGNPLVVLTNYPVQTGKDLQNRFGSAGINIPEECFYSSLNKSCHPKRIGYLVNSSTIPRSFVHQGLSHT